jgi:hypothetical protein
MEDENSRFLKAIHRIMIPKEEKIEIEFASAKLIVNFHAKLVLIVYGVLSTST